MPTTGLMRTGVFVIGSSKHGGMGAPETVPFSDGAAAAAFAAANGGKVVTFAEVPRDYVLSSNPGFNTQRFWNERLAVGDGR